MSTAQGGVSPQPEGQPSQQQPSEQPPQQQNAPATPPTVWKLGTRVAFRFAFTYFGLYAFSLWIAQIPWINWGGHYWEVMWRKVVPWVAAHVLHLSYPITVFTNGSGDTTYDYLRALCMLVIAAVATIVWSVLDRRRLNYAKLHQWLRLWVRLGLAAMLIGYGVDKVIPNQFTPPHFYRLLERYGDSSPMGLLWTFMGASPAYTIFSGLVELVAGVLVLLPRVTNLGALLSMAAMTNVFLLNMCYDVPVKLFSFNLLLMSIFLALPELPRLARVLILNRDTAARKEVPFFSRRALNIGMVVLVLLFCVYVVGSDFQRNYYRHQQIVTKPPLYGIWAVEEFSVDGAVKPPLLTDQTRWQNAIFPLPTLFSVQRMNGAMQNYRVTVDMEKKTLFLTKTADPTWKTSLNFSTPQNDVMVFDGPFDGHNLHVKTRLNNGPFLLTSRGFHWISEFPFNR